MSKVKARSLKKTDTEEDVLELTRERVRTLFDRFDRVDVSFSGGKDSAVLLELCAEEVRARGLPPLDVTFWDEEAISPETEAYVRRTYHRPDINMKWYCVPIENRNACSKASPRWYTWDPKDKDIWVRPLPPEAITEIPGFIYKVHSHHNIQGLLYPANQGTVAHCLGIRAAESLRRFRSVTFREYDNWISVFNTGEKGKKGKLCPQGKHIKVCKPIYDWSTADVWTAAQKFGWDYNRAYDMFELFGLSRHRARISAAFPEEALQNVHMWQELWPELWEKMLKRVPGAATAGRYNESPLYAHYGDAVSKPDDMTWKESIAAEIEKFPSAERKLVAERIKRELTMFKEMYPGQKVPETSPGNSQLSWKLLYIIAKRGDFRGRKGVIYSDKSPTPDAEYLKRKGRL